MPGPTHRPPPLPHPVMYPVERPGRGNKTNKPPSSKEKHDFFPGVYGTSLPRSIFPNQAQCSCGLDSGGSAENKLSSLGDKVLTRGVLGNKLCKDPYKTTMEQLAALNVSKNTRIAQDTFRSFQLSPKSSNEGAFLSWSYPHHQGGRDFSKTFAEMPSCPSDTPLSLIANPALVGSPSVNKYQSVSFPGTQQTVLENYNRYGDGDFLKRNHEASASDFYPATDNSSGGTLSVTRVHRKTGNSHGEDKLLAEEKDASEGAKHRAVLLKYLKNVNLNLRPEPIEDTETSSSAECDIFSYPDFLPVPYNTLDLHKLSFSKGDGWKLSFEPPLEGSVDKLISRLVEMERLQHLTILKERTKEPSASPSMSNRPSSTKEMCQLKQLKAIDFLCPQAPFDGGFHNLGGCMQESDISTGYQCHNKWNSRPISSRVKQLQASGNKCTKVPVTLDSSNKEDQTSLTCCGISVQIQSTARMPPPNTPVDFSSPDNENSQYKLPRKRGKSCRKDGGLTSKALSSQRLKSLSVPAKPRSSQGGHQ